MTELLALIGGCAVLLLMPALGAAFAIYDAYWAAKIWLLLVVPVLHWPALPLAGAVGIALTMRAIRPRSSPPEDKEKSAAQRLYTSIATGFIVPPLMYLVALIVGKVLL